MYGFGGVGLSDVQLSISLSLSLSLSLSSYLSLSLSLYLCHVAFFEYLGLYWMNIFVGPLPGPTMKCVCLVHHPPTTHPPPPTHPRHLAQRSNSALLTVPHPQTHTFSESSWQELFKDGNVTQIQRQWQWQIRWQRQRQWQRQRDWKLNFQQSHALKPIHFLKAHVNSYSKTAT